VALKRNAEQMYDFLQVMCMNRRLVWMTGDFRMAAGDFDGE